MAVPAFVGMLVVAPDFVRVVLGERWSDAVPVLQLLCVAGIAEFVVAMNPSLLVAMGRGGPLLRFTTFSSILTIGGFAVGLIWGLIGVASLYAATRVIVLPVFTKLACDSIGMSIVQWFRNLRSVAEISVAMGIVVYLARLGLVHAHVPAGLGSRFSCSSASPFTSRCCAGESLMSSPRSDASVAGGRRHEAAALSVITPSTTASGTSRSASRVCCGQTLRDWEYVIVDNCSTDGTREIAERYAAADGRDPVRAARRLRRRDRESQPWRSARSIQRASTARLSAATTGCIPTAWSGWSPSRMPIRGLGSSAPTVAPETSSTSSGSPTGERSSPATRFSGRACSEVRTSLEHLRPC